MRHQDVLEKSEHMSKKLSTAQRDMLFYKVAVREAEQREKEMELFRQAMTESTASLSNALLAIGQGINNGLAALAVAQAIPPAQPSNSQVVPSVELLKTRASWTLPGQQISTLIKYPLWSHIAITLRLCFIL